MAKNDTWVIIPAHNEQTHIKTVVTKTKKYAKNVVVVDDGSKDSTYERALKTGVHVLRHVINLGKGAALKTGCGYSLSKGAKKLVFMDADGQHDPADIPRLLSKLKKHDAVFGCRTGRGKMPKILSFGNWFINKVNETLFHIRISDTQSGFRAITAKTYKRITWVSTSYSVESEMIANVGKAGLRYAEIPIKTEYLDRYKGTTVLDGVKIVLNMIWWKLVR